MANNGFGIFASGGATYQYEVDNSKNPQTFCITISKDSINYKITNSSPPALGVCPRFGLIMDLDASNPNSYTGSDTDWSDLSGNNSDGMLQNGVTHSLDGGGHLHLMV